MSFNKFATLFVGILSSLSFHTVGAVSAVPLETEDLYMRPVNFADVDDIAAIALNPEVTKKTGFFGSVNTREDVEAFIKNYLIGDPENGIEPRYPVSWSVVDKQTGRVFSIIALCAYLVRHQRAELGYVTAQDYWNKGYTTQAAQEVIRYLFTQGLNRIYATIDPENEPSERVAQKLGMSYEGLLHSYMLVRGERKDRKMYAVIAPYVTNP